MLAAATTARSAWSSLGTGAPKTAITASPTNCMTVPPSPIMARFIAARWVLSWPASSLGSACSAIVEYERMSLMMTVTLSRSVSPMRRPSLRSFSAIPPGKRRESVSPCSSRSTMARWRLRSRSSAPWWPALTSAASFAKEVLDLGVDGLGCHATRGGDGLDRFAFGDEGEQ